MTMTTRPTKDQLKAEIETAHSGATVMKYGRGVIVICKADQAADIACEITAAGLEVTGVTDGIAPHYQRIYVFGFARKRRGV